MLTHQRREHIVANIYILQRLPSVTRLPDDKNETYKNFQSLQRTKISLLYITKISFTSEEKVLLQKVKYLQISLLPITKISTKRSRATIT